MKSLAKALIITACLGLSAWLMNDHPEMGMLFFLYGVGVTVFYEATWK